MSSSLARRERLALCDLALEVGADAPTLCAGWDAKDLVVHLLVRERKPWAAAGILVPALSGLTERATAAYAGRDLDSLVAQLRTPGLLFSPSVIERSANTFEFVVHHEDLRRGRDGWQPRTLPADDVEQLWAQLGRSIRFLARKLPRPTVLVRADTGAGVVARKGADPVTITGDVVELILFLFGRSATAGLAFGGADDAVAEVRSADLGI